MFDTQRNSSGLVEALSTSKQASAARRLATAAHIGEEIKLATALTANQYDAIYSAIYRKVG